MDKVEKIKVYIRYENGKTACICKKGNKKCSRRCEEDIVERDKFRDWESTFYYDKYGKNKR